MTDFTYFFIVGAQRSGTTYLYHMLDQCRQVSMAKPVKPEPKFFLAEAEEFDLNDYHSNYHSNCGDGVIAYGEKSTSYYESPIVANRILRNIPEAKIVFVLRNPVQRAISNYFFSVQNGLESRSLSQVFLDNKPIDEKFDTSVSPFNYLGRGCYADYVSSYIDCFGLANVKVLLFENLVNDHLGTLSELITFLGLMPANQGSVALNDGCTKNESTKPKDLAIATPVVDRLLDYYTPEIAKLETLIGQDLSNWLIK